jgi:hypothetical protein
MIRISWKLSLTATDISERYMSSKKSSEAVNDLNKPYEENEIGLRGIVWFGIGLLLLIVVTFSLMWALLNVLNDYNRENAGPVNPLLLNERERLPPEPRLQSAPGFGVESEKGRVNLELMAPQSEYRELHRQWMDTWEHGNKDLKSGTVISTSIEDAKEKLLAQGIKSKVGPDAEGAYNKARSFVSDSSSGRVAGEKIR